MNALLRHLVTHLKRSRVGAACCVLTWVLALGLCPVPAAAEVRMADEVCGVAAFDRGLAEADLPDISAPSAIVVTPDGRTWYERDADAPRKIASLTKIMTAIVALEHAESDTIITVDQAAATVGESSAGLREGDTLTLEDALKALLISSGNDAAMAIATSVGGLIDPASPDPYAAFITAMNTKATELGCQDTLFENPHGLDFDAWEGSLHATARDVAKMALYAMQNDLFRTTVAVGACDIPVTSADGSERTVHLRETNALLGSEGNLGIKTGTTYEAGLCFAGAFDDATDGEVITVVLGCTEGAPDAPDPRFTDTLTLLHWWREHQVEAPAVRSEQETMDGTPIAARVSHAGWTDKSVDAVAEDSQQVLRYCDLAEPVELSFDLPACHGDVEPGEVLGSLTYTQGATTLGTVKLVAAERVEAPDPFTWLLVQLDRLVRLFTGEPRTAPTQELAEAPTTHEAAGAATGAGATTV